MATSSATDIYMVIEETRRTPFTNRIASARLHHVGKLKFPEYAGNTDPKVHAGYYRFFAKNLTGAALEWFAGLEENSIDNFTQLLSAFLKQYSVFIETRVTETDLWNLKQAPFEPLRAYINKFREIKAKISHPNEVMALAALKDGVYFSSKFREEMAGRAPISLDNALHRDSYFATHEEETSEDTEEEEEEPATPKSNRKAKGSSNKRGRESEPEPPSSPPPAPKKRVDMILWGSESHTPNRIEGQTKGRVCIDITVAVRTLKHLNEATPPSITRYNPNAGSPFRKIPNFKRKQKMARIRELLERPIAPQIQKKDIMRTLNRNMSGGQRHYRPTPTKRWNFPTDNKGKQRIDFIYRGSKFCNSVNSIKAYQRRAEKSIGVREPLSGPNHEIIFDKNETADLDKPHDDALVIRLDIGGCELSRVMINTGSLADVLFYDAFKRMGFSKALLKQERTPLIGFAGETTYSLGSIELAVTAGEVRKNRGIHRDRPSSPIQRNPWKALAI
ncbi:PREDICTED: uncharacterized protein LOC106324141 [Brassica oleracea var. oleracea]|uniref:uncharacterized protein LOC106324141 n=1 Tax=Brassica oleracea var. oleracea TaxID=109376 RepID=UPI0006A6AC96|nr:PREDICTED: uncharacterized protein LOC106324141 [Brassica oleracea var. oleracea]